MNNEKTRTTAWSVSELTKMALVTSLYVALTIVLAPFGYGWLQIRLSEMFNYLALYNKRYILAVTLGVAIANMASPLGWIDVVFGSACTFLVLLICRLVTKPIKNQKVKMAITGILFALSMCTIAGQLTFLYQAPFFFNWLTIGLGELASMTVGGLIIYFVGKKIDLTQ